MIYNRTDAFMYFGYDILSECRGATEISSYKSTLVFDRNMNGHLTTPCKDNDHAKSSFSIINTHKIAGRSNGRIGTLTYIGSS